MSLLCNKTIWNNSMHYWQLSSWGNKNSFQGFPISEEQNEKQTLSTLFLLDIWYGPGKPNIGDSLPLGHWMRELPIRIKRNKIAGRMHGSERAQYDAIPDAHVGSMWFPCSTQTWGPQHHKRQDGWQETMFCVTPVTVDDVSQCKLQLNMVIRYAKFLTWCARPRAWARWYWPRLSSRLPLCWI